MLGTCWRQCGETSCSIPRKRSRISRESLPSYDCLVSSPPPLPPVGTLLRIVYLHLFLEYNINSFFQKIHRSRPTLSLV
eukprot:21112_5